MKFYACLFAVTSSLFSGMCLAKPLAVGAKAPDFTLKNDAGVDCSLHDFVGKKVVLYFYPKDSTPGCTKEACSLRNSYDDFKKNDIVLLGVSYDSVSSHRKFKEKHNLPFPLLSDSKKKVAKAYGAASTWLFFFTAPIPSRITFLIDEKGVIVAVIKDVDVSNHAKEVLKAFGI
ncbi:peroxiredoxin [Candidatus Babeliales bacterium]|nr:peroxiredoxin [Candidatus Babeliales bacterium]